MPTPTPAPDSSPDPSIDPARFETQFVSVNGVRLAYVRAGDRSESLGQSCPLLLVHGWPESKRLYWKVIEPLADAGFDVIVPDLRGFGESEAGTFGDTVACARDLAALMAVLGHEHYVVCGGDFGGPIVQELALREPDRVLRMVVFNSPLPLDAELRTTWKAAGLRTRPPAEAADYFIRQGTDAEALAEELHSPAMRQRYVAACYTSRFWAHPGAFTPEAVAFHTAPFADASVLRASFRPYEASFRAEARSEPPLLGRNGRTETLILYGASDHVLYPDFDQMAAAVFAHHVGPFLLRNCGHFVPWEAPHAFVSAVRTFCRDLLPASV
jgi:pimeloyl-ACP methyl ester carboxylesterase